MMEDSLIFQRHPLGHGPSPTFFFEIGRSGIKVPYFEHFSMQMSNKPGFYLLNWCYFKPINSYTHFLESVGSRKANLVTYKPLNNQQYSEPP